MKANPNQSIKPKLHSRVLDEGIAVPIYTVAAEFLVRYRDGKQRRARTFERLDQAQEFARFLARRQHWAQAAVELGVRQRTPVMPAFVIGPATAITDAVDQFLLAYGQMGTSATTLRAMASGLRSSVPDAPTMGALSLGWSQQAVAAPNLSCPTRALRRAVIGRFLGWLARQPIEAPANSAEQTADSPPESGHLSVAAAEAVLRACPDLETQRWVALSLFAGLRPDEVESLHWEDVQKAIVVHRAKTDEFRQAPLTANLIAWLKVPAQAHGPVVTKSARHKAKALLLKLKLPLHALRTTCVLCWLALHGAEQTALQAGVSKVPSPDQVHYSVSRAEAECFFGLTPD